MLTKEIRIKPNTGRKGRKADMSEDKIVRKCAPTLAGLKIGNLFNCIGESGAGIRDDIRSVNRRLGAKGIRAVPVRRKDGSTLVYLYRPKMLEQYFEEPDVRALLEQFGYPEESPECCVSLLAQKLNREQDFPHEIGLFLGYPAEDVKGFIENHSECSKCVGNWKVYGDVQSAQKKFAAFRKCTEVYCREFRKGVSLEKLTLNR